jgi:hypothetical protein
MTIIALIMTSVKRRRDIVDILGFDVAGKLSDDIVKNTVRTDWSTPHKTRELVKHRRDEQR